MVNIIGKNNYPELLLSECVRGAINKTSFFLFPRTSETPPPPLRKKIKKKVLGKISKKCDFLDILPNFLLKTLLDWVRPPPPFGKKSKQISVFSVKEILDSTRPPLSGNVKKKTVFFYCSPYGVQVQRR